MASVIVAGAFAFPANPPFFSCQYCPVVLEARHSQQQHDSMAALCSSMSVRQQKGSAAGEQTIGARAYRVLFASISLPLAVVAVVFFINHRYDGIPLWNLRQVPGTHEFVWLLNFVSFFFLYPSTFNLLEVRFSNALLVRGMPFSFSSRSIVELSISIAMLHCCPCRNTSPFPASCSAYIEENPFQRMPVSNFAVMLDVSRAT